MAKMFAVAEEIAGARASPDEKNANVLAGQARAIERKTVEIA
jgi:hypothetical protein